jgi:hypothetical protein
LSIVSDRIKERCTPRPRAERTGKVSTSEIEQGRS